MLVEPAPQSIAYAYDGTIEGLLTAVFLAYANHEDPQDVLAEENLQLRLGQDVRIVETSTALAQRVRTGICATAGTKAYNACKLCALSCLPDAGTRVYRFIRYAMKQGPSCLNNIMHPAVAPVLEAKRAMATEKEHMLQFIRFEELEGGLWFAQCNPKTNVIPFIMDFFAARFNTQPFVIFDENHALAGIYDTRTWWLASVDSQTFREAIPAASANEARMAHAWRTFYQSVSVDARYNPELRTHWMPKRFWKNITEMQEELPSLVLS